MKKFTVLILVLFFFCSFSVSAQEEDYDIEVTHESAEEVHSHHFHKNHFGVFVGATTELEKDEDTHFTLGVDYSRRVTSDGRFGIGVFGEAIFADDMEWIIGVPLYFYPTNNFWLRAGPGVEFHKEETESGNETEAEFLIRTGVGYTLEFKKFAIAPSISVDFLRNKTALVWGINIVKPF